MSNRTKTIKYNYNLKSKSEEQTLIYLIGYLDKRYKVSTKQTVFVKTWNAQKQRCEISSAYPERVNRASRKVNKFLDVLDKELDLIFKDHDPKKQIFFRGLGVYVWSSASFVKKTIQDAISNIIKGEQEEEEKEKITPLQYFAEYVERDRIDPHTGRYVSERTKVHHRTVLHRLQEFFQYAHLANDFSAFDNPLFDEKYMDWCYKVKKYKLNTIRATYGVLKPWLNAAKKDGYNVGEQYKKLCGKGEDVDNIYLTESEIESIYRLDIKALKASGDIDTKSEMESTRDLFIIGCWTGLRQSDLNKLNDALFDIDQSMITITAEKTKRKVVIPMHPYVKELWQKYQGVFPKLCHKSKANQHLKECGRLAQIDVRTPIIENRAGQANTVIYPKYQLIGMHTARRSFATNMYKRGFPTLSIMQLTGHTTEHNFLKYIKVTKEENAQMIAKQFEIMFKEDELKEREKKEKEKADFYNDSPSQVQHEGNLLSLSGIVSIQDYNNKVEENCLLKKEVEQSTAIKAQYELKKKEVEDYEKIYGYDEYLDKVADIALEADQEAIVKGEKP